MEDGIKISGSRRLRLLSVVLVLNHNSYLSLGIMQDDKLVSRSDSEIEQTDIQRPHLAQLIVACPEQAGPLYTTLKDLSLCTST